MDFIVIANSITLSGFALSSLLYLTALWHDNYRRIINILAFLSFLLSTTAATFTLFHSSAHAERPVHATLLLVVCLGWLAISAQRESRLRMMAPFMAPFISLILLSQLLSQSSVVIPLKDDSATLLISFHILTAVITQVFAVFACAMAILYLWKQRILKQRLIERITGNIPDLNRLELYMIRLVWGGFVLATFSLVSGALFAAYYIDPNAVSLGGKTLWAIMLWAWLLLVLLSKTVFHLSRKRLAQICVIGFAAVAISYMLLGYFVPIGGG